MKMISVYDSVGCILSHDVTQIIPGEFKGRLFKKGSSFRNACFMEYGSFKITSGSCKNICL